MIEEYLDENFKPLLSLNTLISIFEADSEEDWGVYSGSMPREQAEEMMALHFAIKLVGKYLMKQRPKNAC